MEDIIALVLVVGIFALFAWGVTTLLKRMKREKEQQAERQAAADKYWKEQREKINVPTHWAKQPAPAIKAKKPEPISKTYASMNTKKASTTTTAPVSDDNFFEGIVTGMVVNSLIDSITHKSEPSYSSSKSESSSSWGLDDSDSRKSISDSMDTSSSWSSSSSSDFGSSDSGPSSDW